MYRIVSFDGGGVRGLLSARMLERLVPFADVAGKADMLAGTSTGGLIALALAKGMGPSEIVDWYYERSSAIFNRDFGRRLNELLGAKYPQAGLRIELEKVLPFPLRMVDLSKRVIIPAFRLDGERWQPNTFDSGHLEDSSLPALDAALATSAAPTYFPTAWFALGAGSKMVTHGYCDGGVYANDPTMEAITIALRDGVNLRDIRVVSFGTGLTAHSIPEAAEHSLDWGPVEWISSLVNLLFDGPQEATATQCVRLLRDSYCRVNPVLGKQIGLDAADKASLDELLRAADAADDDLRSAEAFLRKDWS